MSKDTTEELLGEMRLMKSSAPWASPVISEIEEAATLLAVASSRERIHEKAKIFMMLRTLTDVAAESISKREAGLPDLQWRKSFDRIPVFARAVKNEIMEKMTSRDIDPLELEMQALEHRYGDLQPEKEDVIPLPEKMRHSELDFKSSLLRKISGAGVSYVSRANLMDIKEGVKPVTHAELLLAISSETSGGEIRFAGQPWLRFLTKGETDELGIETQRIKMRDIGPGQKVTMRPMTPYVFACSMENVKYKGTSIRPKNLIPNERNYIIGFIMSDKEAIINGPASFSEWDEEVLGPLNKRKNIFGQEKFFDVNRHRVVITDRIRIKSHNIGSYELPPFMSLDTIQKAKNLYDWEDKMSGNGANTMITYKETDRFNGVATGRVVIPGIMPKSIMKILLNTGNNKSLGHEDLCLPSPLRMTGIMPGQYTESSFIDVARTSKEPTWGEDADQISGRAASRLATMNVIKNMNPALKTNITMNRQYLGKGTKLVMFSKEDDMTVRIKENLLPEQITMLSEIMSCYFRANSVHSIRSISLNVFDTDHEDGDYENIFDVINDLCPEINLEDFMNRSLRAPTSVKDVPDSGRLEDSYDTSEFYESSDELSM